LINVEFCNIEELNVLSYFFFPRFLSMFVKFVTVVHTVGRKWFNGCGDVACWIFFMGVRLLITPGWVLVTMITTFR